MTGLDLMLDFIYLVLYNTLMFGFLSFLWLLSFVAIVLGLAKPRLFSFIFRKNPSRKLSGFSAVGLSILILIGLIITAPPSTQSSTNNVPTPTNTTKIKPITASKPTPTQKSKPTTSPTKQVTPALTATPTPSSGNPLCDSNVDGAQFDQCLRIKYPLNATVNADGVNVYVTNPSSTNWTGCSMQTDDGNWQMNGYDNFDVPAGSTGTVGWGRMTDGNGNRFDYTKTQPGPIDISCFIGKEIHEGQYRGF